MKNNSHHGFTLLESILYIGVAALIIVSISIFLASALKSRNKNTLQATVQSEGTQAFQIMTQTIETGATIEVLDSN